MSKAIAVLTLLLPCFGQSLPSSWIGGGTSLNGGSWVSYARCKGVNCSYTTYDVSMAKHRYTTATRTGIATAFRSYKLKRVDFHSFLFVNAGISSSSELSPSVSGGGIIALKWRNGFSVVGVLRRQKSGNISNDVYEVGVGWAVN